MIKTKIVATLGPASSGNKIITDLMQAGVSVFRLNFSHGSYDDHAKNIHCIRSASRKLKRHVAILADLQGPKIRTGLFENKEVMLKMKKRVKLVTGKIKGNENIIAVDYSKLPDVVVEGMIIYLNEGLVKLRVESKSKGVINCSVIKGGMVGEHKGINIVGIKLASAFTSKDKRDIRFAIEKEVDYFALSFVRDVSDIRVVKNFISSAGGMQPLIAKIEKPEAVKNIKSILEEAAGVMVARGDLGVEGKLEQVPVWQKRIIHEANAASKFVITATQMFESMITSPMPTRAEVADVANAIFDGTCAVMLSGETAIGKNPVQVIKTMKKVINTAERSNIYDYYLSYFSKRYKSTTYSVAHAAIDASFEADVKGIIVLTISGRTAKYIAKRRPRAPIFAFSPSKKACREMAAFWGVEAHRLELKKDLEHVVNDAAKKILAHKWLKPGSRVVVVYGGKNESGCTDRMRIMTL